MTPAVAHAKVMNVKCSYSAVRSNLRSRRWRLKGVRLMASVKVSLACTVCGARNYTVRVKAQHTERLTLNKYCKHCQKETQHQETR